MKNMRGGGEGEGTRSRIAGNHRKFRSSRLDLARFRPHEFSDENLLFGVEPNKGDRSSIV